MMHGLGNVKKRQFNLCFMLLVLFYCVMMSNLDIERNSVRRYKRDWLRNRDVKLNMHSCQITNFTSTLDINVTEVL